MKKVRIILVSAAVLAAAVFLVLKYGVTKKNVPAGNGSRQPVHAEQAGSGNADNATEAASVTQRPEEQAEAPSVEIPVEKRRIMGVRTVTVAVKPMLKVIRSVGRIDYDERRLATVNTKLEGWIEQLHVDYTGRYVKKGEILAEIYSPELMATQQEYLNVIKWSSTNASGELGKMLSKDAEAIVEAARQRLRLKDITDEQIKNIEMTGKPIRTFSVYSPVSGYVVQKNAIRGMRVMPGEKLFDLADLSSVWVIADIFEYDLPFVRVGQNAVISLGNIPGSRFNSRIDYIYPSLSGDTRTVKARFSIPNPGGRLKPQMFADVEIKSDLGKRLVVPDDAVLDTGMRKVVYVDKGDDNFEPRDVTVGIKADGMSEITAGLKAGEKVSSAANFLIDSEAKLKGVVK
jgi:Cu(I)/Ag(I) efflux system membrane fusion protein